MKLDVLDVLFLVILGVFIAMKLMGKLAWSWWWVLSPLWGIVAVVILFGVILGGAAGAAESGGHIRAFFRRRSRLKKLYNEPADLPKPTPTTPTDPDNRWWE